MQSVNELTSLEMEAEFNDSVGSPTIPATAHWRVRCVTTDKVLTDWAQVTVLTESDSLGNVVRHYAAIDVPASANAIQRSANRYEIKEVIVSANKDSANEYNQQTPYRVVNTGRA